MRVSNTPDGLVFSGDPCERIEIIKIQVCHGRVEVWIKVNNGGAIDELVQYLGPTEAMAFSSAFRRAAIAALEQEADHVA